MSNIIMCVVLAMCCCCAMYLLNGQGCRQRESHVI